MKNQHWPPGTKIFRQIRLYHYLMQHENGYRGPNELKHFLSADIRMIQRDLKDLRDAGLCKLKYDKKTDNYINHGEPSFIQKTTPRRREHLLRLYRLCTLMDRLEGPDMEEVDSYESALYDYEKYLEHSKDDPELYPMDEMDDPPEPPDFPDIKSQYESLFPGLSARTRQRDFETLSKAGYQITYRPEFKAYLIQDYIEDEFDDPWKTS